MHRHIIPNSQMNETIRKINDSGIHLDGRNLLESREISFIFPPDVEKQKYGCQGGRVVASIGQTSVMCVVSLEIVTPDSRNSSQGLLKLRINSSILRKFNPRAFSLNTANLQAVLQQTLLASLDLDCLCIVAGESVFCLSVEVRLLTNSGGLVDCVGLAALLGLVTFRRPDISMGSDRRVLIHCEARERDLVPLTFRKLAFLTSVGVVAGEAGGLLVDGEVLEEQVLAARILIGLTAHFELCCLSTGEVGCCLSSHSLLTAVELANQRVAGLQAVLDAALEVWEKRRRQCGDSRLLPVTYSSVDLLLLIGEINKKEEEILDYQPIMLVEERPIYRPTEIGQRDQAFRETAGHLDSLISEYDPSRFDVGLVGPDYAPRTEFSDDEEEEGQLIELG